MIFKKQHTYLIHGIMEEKVALGLFSLQHIELPLFLTLEILR